MTAIARTLDTKLKQWRPATVRKVVQQVALIIRQAEQSSKTTPARRKQPRPYAVDPLLTDQALFTGSTPADLAAAHDRYLYDN